MTAVSRSSVCTSMPSPSLSAVHELLGPVRDERRTLRAEERRQLGRHGLVAQVVDVDVHRVFVRAGDRDALQGGALRVVVPARLDDVALPRVRDPAQVLHDLVARPE